MNGDFYINTIVSSCTEMLSYTVSGFILTTLGIKFSYFLSFSAGIIGATLYIIMHTSYQNLTPLFLFLASFGISSSLNIDWNINSILFPVIFNSSTNGICNLFARISDSLAPQAAELQQPIPMVIVGGMCLVGALICWGLKLEHK